MNINSISTQSFEGKVPKITKFYVPGKDNTTLRCKTVGDIVDMTKIDYDILKKGEVLESKSYHNKKGFSCERFAQICGQIQKKVHESFDFLEELLEAQRTGGN